MTWIPTAFDLVEHEVYDVVVVRSSNQQIVARESFLERRDAARAAARERRRCRSMTFEAREVRVERVGFRTTISTSVVG